MVEQDGLFDEKPTRLDSEWITYNALRDGVGIALRNLGLAGHRDTLRLAQRVAPELFATSESLLVKEWESPEEREVHEIATALSISFDSALSSEIDRLESFVKGNTNQKERPEALNRRLLHLKTIRSNSELREYYEGKLIERDARIGHGGTPETKRSDNYFDYSLPAGRFMRIRVVHETKVEAINGADLIYEHHALGTPRVRIAAVQYKILKENRYIEKTRQLKSQLTRLENCFCNGLPCKSGVSAPEMSFRLPTCSAFLRPTHRLQSTKSSVISRGYYLPVCIVQTLWKDKIEINEVAVKKQVVRQAMFEDLFNADLLGSRWITVDELDALYRMQKILEGTSETSLVHVKTYDG